MGFNSGFKGLNIAYIPIYNHKNVDDRTLWVYTKIHKNVDDRTLWGYTTTHKNVDDRTLWVYTTTS